ncbi:hypothetical protein SCA6_017178 [Theobroma cacao]
MAKTKENPTPLIFPNIARCASIGREKHTVVVDMDGTLLRGLICIRVFASCGKRCVLTATPRVIVEVFLNDYLRADRVMGTEIHVFRGRATGLVKSPGVLVGKNKADALENVFKGEPVPDIALGDPKTDYPFMKL